MESHAPIETLLKEAVDVPRATAALAGTGGDVKERPEDFEVEELPAYPPCGSGEHLFVRLWKRGLSTPELISHVAERLEIPAASIGAAGNKDKHAVTWQFLSVPATAMHRLHQIEAPDVRLGEATPHRHKLRTGHLRGNRFRILLRNTHPNALSRAERVAQCLEQAGLPNYFGTQRFGHSGSTLRQGLELLCGRSQRRRGRMARLALSSVQSALFNAYLAERWRDGLLGSILPGDVMQVRASGGIFVAENEDREQSRFESRETVMTGPIFGPKMRSPSLDPAKREEVILARFHLTVRAFGAFGKMCLGTRRPLLVWPQELAFAAHSEGLQLVFVLPPGSYATVLLAEFTGRDLLASAAAT